MKKLFVVFVVLFAANIFAQDVDAFVEMLRSDLKTQKVEIITEVMDFTEEESAAFWPLYRQYDLDLTKIKDVRVALIKDYAANFDNMTNEKAKELMNGTIKYREDELKLRKKYFKEFDKILPTIKAARFMQLENQIDLLINLQIASELPLVEMPDETPAATE
jgi:hypothetical protein